MSKTALQILLLKELARRCEANSQYSLRAFALFLGVSPSYLSKILNGIQTGSASTLEKIGARLKLDALEIERLRRDIEKRKRRSKAQAKRRVMISNQI